MQTGNAPSSWRGWRLVAAALSLLAAGRLVLLFVQRALGDPGARSFKIEAAGTALALAASLVVVLTPPRPANRAKESAEPVPWLHWPLFVLGALILYWPALSAGFLSDDLVLMSEADRWRIGPITPSLLRPLTMAVWGLLRKLGADPAAFHALNIALHGTAAFLTSRLAAGWVSDRRLSAGAGVLFLVFPIAVEPVAWVSGGFDLMATVFILALVQIGRRYAGGARFQTRLLFFALGLAALFSKETAVVAGALVLLDAFLRRAFQRELLTDAVALMSIAAVFGVIRGADAGYFEDLHINKYIAQQALFQSIGGLAQQWPAQVASTYPWQAVVQVVGLILLILHFAWTSGRERFRLLAVAGAWILVAIAPVFMWIMISHHLEGSRYLYLAAPAWAILLVAMASSAHRRWSRSVAWLVIGLTIVMSAWAARVQMGAWSDAAAMRDTILQGLEASDAVRNCQAITLTGYPDNVRGAYVFRNGLPEAMAGAGLPSMRPDAPVDCRFHWDDGRRAVVRD